MTMMIEKMQIDCSPADPAGFVRRWLLRFGLLLLLTIVTTSFAWAAGGDVNWDYTVAMADKQEAQAAAFDSQGNSIMVGFTGEVNMDYRVAKVRSDGSGTVWTASFSLNGGIDIATAVMIDSADDVIVTGYGHDNNNYDFHTIKYSGVDGTVLWQHTYNGPGNGDDFAMDVAVDDLNNIYVTGHGQDLAGKDDILVLKYAPSGPNPDDTPIWTASYNASGNGHDRAYAITAGVDGIAVTGESQNATPDFDCQTLKYSFDGILQWSRSYFDTGDGRGQDVVMDISGHVIMTGYVSNGTDRDLYVIKYAPANAPAEWVNIFDAGYDDEGASLWIDSVGDLYVTGTTFSLATAKDLFAARYRGSDGSTVWQTSYNSANGDNDFGLDIIVDEQGEVFVGGYDDNAVSGFDDFLVIKYARDDGALLWDRSYDGAGHDDRAVGVGLSPTGELLVAGWSDRWTSGATDIDFQALQYDPGHINPPTGLNAQTVSTSEITLSWTDNSTSEQGFDVERRVGPTGDYQLVTTLPADSESFNDTGLTADTRYYYRVKANHDTIGDSIYSNEANIRTTVVNSGAPSWLYHLNGPDSGDDYATGIAVGADNDPVVTGYSFAFDGAFDYLTVKLDRDTAGELWQARYNDGDNETDVATAVIVDSNNQVVVTGYASLYGGGAGNTNDVYTISYPAGGPPSTWTDQYNGPDGDDDRSSAVSVARDGSDNLVVIGYGKNALWNDDIYVIKYLANGSRDWAAVPFDGGGNDYPSGVTFDASGNVCVVGWMHNGTDDDYFVAKYSGVDGSLLWSKSFDGTGHGNDHAEGVVADSAGNLYVTGSSVNAAGNSDFYTIKYAGSDGSILWEKSYDGEGHGYDHAIDIVVDPVSTEIVVAGTSFVGTGNHDIQVIRYQLDSTIVWQKSLDLPGSDDGVVDMTIDASGVVTIAGMTSSGSDEDILAVKFDYDGAVAGQNIYSGSAGGDDEAAGVAVNSYGEAFVAGSETNASGNTDYLVFKVDGDVLQAPAGLTAAPLYASVLLSWQDNALNEDGYQIERKVGACADVLPWSVLPNLPLNTVSYNDSNLNIGATYCYRLRAFNGSGEVSRWAMVETTTAAPVAPSNLNATPLNTTQISLTWDDNTSGEDGFRIYRTLGGSTDTIDVPANSVSYIDAAVAHSQSYDYYLIAFQTAVWSSGASNTVSGVTTPTPVQPSALSAVRVSETQINVSWADNTADETGFTLERCLGAACNEIALGANQTSYNDTGRQQETTYDYRIKAYKTATNSWDTGYTTVASATTSLAAPSSLNVTVGNTTQLNLTWTDKAVSETGYRLERCAGSGTDCDEDVEFALLVNLPANSISHSDSTVCSGSDYSYRLRTENPAWPSNWSAWAGPVVGTTTSPVPPDSLAVTSLSEAEVTIDWNTNTTDEDGFILERCLGDGATCTSDLDFADQVPVNIDDTLQLHYRMDEALWSGNGSVRDTSRYGRHGNPGGGVTTLATGKYDRAGSFNGSNQYVYTPLNIDQSSSSAGVTFEAWAYPTVNNSSYKYIISTDNGGSDWSLLYRYGNWYIMNGAGTYSTSATVTFNQWQHIAVTFQPGVGVRVYKNGALAWSSASIAYDTSDYNVTIGRRGTYTTSSYHYPGRVDEVLVFNRPLAAAEIQNHYLQKVNLSVVTDGPLEAATTYTYRLKAVKTADCDWETPPIYATHIMPAPQAPNGLTANDLDTTQIDLSWTDNTATESGFLVERCIGTGTACDEDSEFSTLSNRAANTQAYSDTSVCNGTDYTYRIQGEKTGDPTGWPTPWALFPAVNTTVPATPGSFATAQGSETRIDLSWADLTADETGFKIERCLDAACATVETELIAGANAVSYSDTGLTPNTTYYYRVRAYKTASCPWETPNSPIVSEATTVLAPNSFVATAINTSRIDLAWTDRTVTETAFVLERCPGSGAACDEDSEFSLMANLPSDTQSYSDTDVCNGTEYSYRVRAENPAWTGGWTIWAGPVTATTLSAVAPSGFSAVAETETQILLSWQDNNVDEDSDLLERCIGSGTSCDEDVEFTSVVPVTSDAELLYQMDEMVWDAAMTVADSSDKDRPGSPNGGVTTIAAGKYGRAGEFDGSNDYVTVPITIDQSASTSGATFEAWVYPTVNTATYKYVVSTDNSGNDWSLYQYSTVWGLLNGTGLVNTTVAVNFNQWQHIAVVFDPVAGVTLYKNGVAAYSNPSIGFDTSSAGINIGRRGTMTEYFPGRIDEVRVFQRVLSAAEVLKHYNNPINNVELVDTGLMPATTYTYRLNAAKTAGCGWETSPVFAEATTLAPQAPSGFSAALFDTTRIDLSWTDNTTSETSFDIERCPGSGVDCDEDAEFAVQSSPPADDVSSIDDTVCNSTTYTYRVRAAKSGNPPGWPTAWDYAPAVTTATPAAPTTLDAVQVSEVWIDLSWADNTSDETGFKIERCLDAGCVAIDAELIVGADQVSYGDTGLVANTTYYYQIRAYKTAGCSWETFRSSVVSESTDVIAPASLVVAPVDTTTLSLTWTDKTASESSFRVERCPGSGAACDEDIEFSYLTELPADSTGYTDISLSRSTQYSYRVRAEHSGWSPTYTDWSPVIAATTTTPGVPDGLSALSVTAASIELNWTDHTMDETGFELDRCLDAACLTVEQTFDLGANSSSYTDSGLLPAVSYYYRVRAYKTADQPWFTDYSAIVSDDTLPEAASGLTAAAVNSLVVQLSWDAAPGANDGYEVEMEIWNGRFVVAKILPVSDTECMINHGLDPGSTYRFRVRVYRAGDMSLYSNEASVTMPAYTEGDTTCLP